MRRLAACSMLLAFPTVAHAGGEVDDTMSANFGGQQLLKGSFVSFEQAGSRHRETRRGESLTVLQEFEMVAELAWQTNSTMSFSAGSVLHVFTEQPMSVDQELFTLLTVELGSGLNMTAGLFANPADLGSPLFKGGFGLEQALGQSFTLDAQLLTASHLALGPVHLAETEFTTGISAPLGDSLEGRLSLQYAYDHEADRSKTTLGLSVAGNL